MNVKCQAQGLEPVSIKIQLIAIIICVILFIYSNITKNGVCFYLSFPSCDPLLEYSNLI